MLSAKGEGKRFSKIGINRESSHNSELCLVSVCANQSDLQAFSFVIYFTVPEDVEGSIFWVQHMHQSEGNKLVTRAGMPMNKHKGEKILCKSRILTLKFRQKDEINI